VNRKFISVEEAAKEWMKRPEFVAAYDALEDEFAVASALIKARGDAAMTQEQVARAMGTTQADALDPHLGAVCEGHAYAPAHQLRTGKTRKVREAIVRREPPLLDAPMP
jgi:hypothetical protein